MARSRAIPPLLLFTFAYFGVSFNSIEGHGATFHFSATLACSEADSPTEKLPILTNKKILLVVRNNLLRGLLTEQLLAWGSIVTPKSTSTEALTVPIDGLCLVIADINGRPDDAKLLHTFALPTILLRLGGEEERLKEAKEKNGAKLLFKPVRAQEFRQAVLRVLAPSTNPGTSISPHVCTRVTHCRQLFPLPHPDKLRIRCCLAFRSESF